MFHDASGYFDMNADDEKSDEQRSDGEFAPEVYYEFFNQKPRRQRRYREKRDKKGLRVNPMPMLKGKTTYLRYVGAYDCIKDEVSGLYSMHSTQNKQQTKPRKQNKKDNKTEQEREQTDEEPNSTKLERKKKFRELKKTLKGVWTTKMETSDESDKDKDAISVPSHYKKYTIQDRHLVVEQPKRE